MTWLISYNVCPPQDSRILSSLLNFPYFFSGSQKSMTRLIHTFPHFYIHSTFSHHKYNDVMVRILAPSAVDRWFEAASGQTTDYMIGICCFFTTHAALEGKNKEWLARNQYNVSESSGATCLPTDCCFSELALYKSN